VIKNNGCCDLEYAKKLKSLKVKQESLWWWIIRAEGNPIIVGKDKRYTTTFISSSYSAFTVAELGEMLPNSIDKFVMVIMKMNKGTWVCGYYKDLKEMFYEVGDKILVTAMAKMLIWLIENKMMEVGSE